MISEKALNQLQKLYKGSETSSGPRNTESSTTLQLEDDVSLATA